MNYLDQWKIHVSSMKNNSKIYIVRYKIFRRMNKIIKSYMHLVWNRV